MGQFNNYFEKDYVGTTEYIPYPDISNLWPINREAVIEPKRNVKTCKAGEYVSGIIDILEEKDYVTEGDVCDVLKLRSTVSNPYRFYDGNQETYRTCLQKRLEERRQKINSYRREVRLIEEALKELQF